jgi:hypothetical protein
VGEGVGSMQGDLSGFLRPNPLLQQLILHSVDVDNVALDPVGYDDRAGLTLFEKRHYLVPLVWSSAWHETTPCRK